MEWGFLLAALIYLASIAVAWYVGGSWKEKSYRLDASLDVNRHYEKLFENFESNKSLINRNLKLLRDYEDSKVPKA